MPNTKKNLDVPDNQAPIPSSSGYIISPHNQSSVFNNDILPKMDEIFDMANVNLDISKKLLFDALEHVSQNPLEKAIASLEQIKIFKANVDSSSLTSIKKLIIIKDNMETYKDNIFFILRNIRETVKKINVQVNEAVVKVIANDLLSLAKTNEIILMAIEKNPLTLPSDMSSVHIVRDQLARSIHLRVRSAVVTVSNIKIDNLTASEAAGLNSIQRQAERVFRNVAALRGKIVAGTTSNSDAVKYTKQIIIFAEHAELLVTLAEPLKSRAATSDTTSPILPVTNIEACVTSTSHISSTDNATSATIDVSVITPKRPQFAGFLGKQPVFLSSPSQPENTATNTNTAPNPSKLPSQSEPASTSVLFKPVHRRGRTITSLSELNLTAAQSSR